MGCVRVVLLAPHRCMDFTCMELAGKHRRDLVGDILAIFLQRKMAGVVEADLGARNGILDIRCTNF